MNHNIEQENKHITEYSEEISNLKKENKEILDRISQLRDDLHNIKEDPGKVRTKF